MPKKGYKQSKEHLEKNKEGHKGQKAWNKGLTKKDHRVLKYILSESLTMKGKHYSPNTEFKKGIHVSRRTEFKKGNISIKPFKKGNIPWNKGKHNIYSKETLERMKIGSYGNKAHLGHKHIQKVKDKLREKRLKEIFPKKDSSIELKLQQQLTQQGFTFEKHKPITGQPDIYIASLNICIFADGCYWHGCHECFGFNNNKSAHWHRDFRIKHELELEGYRVVRLWEHDIKKEDFNIIKYIF